MKLPYVAGMLAAVLIPIIFTGCTQQVGSDGEGRGGPANVQPSTVFSTPTASPSEILMSASPRPTLLHTVAPQPSKTSTPKATATKNPGSTASTAKKRAILQLRNIRIAEANYGVDYNRTKDFGTAWKDVDPNGCDTRNDILKRHLTNITYRSDDPGCTIATGTLHDPYTATKIKFVRGPQSAVIQIDHVAALHLIAMHGGESWSQTKREQYANDPDVLLAVDGSANMQKSDSGPADWMPPNSAYRCTYVEKFTNAIYKYNATMSRRDAAKVKNVLDTCK